MRSPAVILTFLLCLRLAAAADGRTGSVRVTALDASGAAVARASVILQQDAAFLNSAETNDQGSIAFHRVPYGPYTLQVKAPGFADVSQDVRVASAVVLELRVVLKAGARAEVTVSGSTTPADTTATTFAVHREALQATPGAHSEGGMRRALSALPGFVTEDNGLLHVRGVDDGLLYVLDGVPFPDRADNFSAVPFDLDQLEAMQVISGNIPAEFGGRSGAVVVLEPRSGVDTPLQGMVGVRGGSFDQAGVTGQVAGRLRQDLFAFGMVDAGRSQRFLDPVSPDNLHNTGAMLNGNVHLEWTPTVADVLSFRAEARRARFDVPHDTEQELAKQDQRQRLENLALQLSWQRAIGTNTALRVTGFRQGHESTLNGEDSGVPLAVEARRSHRRTGVTASVSTIVRKQLVKAGIELSRVTPHEFLRFAVTDPISAEEHEISTAAQQFVPGNPFVFSAHDAGSVLGAFLQTTLAIHPRVTVDLGLRYDRTTLLLAEDAWSPRVGVSYAWPRVATLRASYNRFFMPPQVENMLLASSEQARALSPFAADGGGAEVRAERSHTWEVGAQRQISRSLRIDAAAWWRKFDDVADPNVFFSTTLIFPNSVASGRAHGVDVRLDGSLGPRWSGYLSYGNQSVVQYGPISGGLFLTDEFIEIGPGTRFRPDHDQRNSGGFGITYTSGWHGAWISLTGNHQSGVPLEVDDDRLGELQALPGAELVDFQRKRVRPWSTFDVAAGMTFQHGKIRYEPRVEVFNLFDRDHVFNFGSPFSGTHFGMPRSAQAELRVRFGGD
jgi:outer membrane receptor protein involved in Fe transport